MQVRELVSKGAMIIFVRVLGSALMFFFLILSAREYGVEIFGLFSLGITIIGILAVFVRFGLDNIVLKHVSINIKSSPEVARGYLWTSVRLIIFMGLVYEGALYFSAPFLSVQVFNMAGLGDVLDILTIGLIPFSLIFIGSEYLKAVGRPLLSSITQTTLLPMFAIMMVLAFKDNVYIDGKELLPMAYVVGLFIVLVVMVGLGRNSFFYKKGEKAKYVCWKNSLREASPMFVIAVSSLLIGWTDMIVLGIFSDAKDVGVYSAAMKTVVITSMVLIAVNTLTAPRYAILYKAGDYKGIANLARNSFYVLFVYGLLTTTGIFLFAEQIMSLFGDGFKDGAVILMILGVAQFVNVACGSVGYLLMMTGNEKVLRNICLTVGLLNICLAVILVKIYGAVGVAIASVIAMLAWNIIGMHFIKKRLGFWTVGFDYKEIIGLFRGFAK